MRWLNRLGRFRLGGWRRHRRGNRSDALGRGPGEVAAELAAVFSTNNQPGQLRARLTGTEVHPHHATFSGSNRGTMLCIHLKVPEIVSLHYDGSVKLCHATIRELDRKTATRSNLQLSELQLGWAKTNRGKDPRERHCQNSRH